ncbi:DNA-binding transcriptional regulator, MarR family [Nocardiopsis flavescens]|uniref:DNA-binding transcriptional regulator, MarR family n=1 Tax=Nocardiopsis flavescens TaxID=758803 RepID=A0A1M6NW22_9ACTN|nr:MarR family winged helix-turn-helix transcriptional regulator [Nocardiopsis flavescens]SHJ99850.1 DNA-binding transcriptional regulator, MarR family [Nocardiopsis flavescens]
MAENEDGPGRTLFRFVRHWARGWNGTDGGDANGRDVMVVEAVADLADRATVTAVAEELGIDQSGASRMVAGAVERGHLRKEPSPGDRRARVLVVTEQGDDLLRSARGWQEAVFAELARGWPEEDVRTFRRLMASLVERHPRGSGAARR